MTSTALTVVQATFEAADLEEGIADLVVAGMSFHWVDQVLGLPKLRRLLRPGGSAALWWTVYGDPARPDPFADAAAGLVGRAGGQPDPVSGLPFELDADAWRTSLERDAGLVDVATERIPWMVRLDAAGVRALYGSTMTVLRRPEPERLALLDELERIADQAFHGLVERPFVTAIHTGRREA
jgi:SAM-dependent methyltransferase